MAEVTIVFNNRRPSLFMRQYIQEEMGDTCFLPRIVGFDDLVAELGELEIVPNEFLLFELYDIHRRLNPEDRRTLEEFIPMADMMIGDFSEIDSYMVEVGDIYGNLHDLKRIGEWDISGKELTQFQKDYLRFYKSIYSYYKELHRLLESRGQAYTGMAYREVAENIERRIDRDVFGDIYFLGFNALTKCEEVIIEAYIRRGRAKYVTDGDAYYYDNEDQEAGYFLRKHKRLSANKEFAEHFKEGRKSVHIVRAQDNVTQAKYAGQLLRSITNEEQGAGLADTALVLADENLITPVLNSLPEEVTQANITMGIRYTSTEMHSLVLTVMSLYANMRGSKRMFYHKDLCSLLGNPYVARLLKHEDAIGEVKAYMARNNIIYASVEEIEAMLTDMGMDVEPLRFIFTNDSDRPESILATLKRLVEELRGQGAIDVDSKEHAAAESLVQIIEYFKGLENHYDQIGSIKAFQKIYQRIAERRTISFMGSPLTGLQILGVLETRNIDFKRVILLSANEGVIPSERSANTLIPNSLKRGFGMPTYEEKESIYAYNFYRLIQRATDVYLVSSTDTNGPGKGVESRFVQQVRAELSKRYASNMEVTETTVLVGNKAFENEVAGEVEKTPAIMQRLYGKRYSPSSLNKYRACPLKFYYEDVLYANDDDEVADVLDERELGNVVHKCLEEIYKPYLHKDIKKEDIEQAFPQVEDMIEKLIGEYFVNGQVHEGKNDLYRMVAIQQVKSFLKHEIGLLEEGHSIYVEQLEEVMDKPVRLQLNGKERDVAFKTKADRIDRIDGQLRVIDYKTGNVEGKNLKADNLDTTEWQKIEDKWFQVMFYAWYYVKLHTMDEPVLTGLYPLRALGSEFMPAYIGTEKEMTKEHFDKFEELLSGVLAEIMDSDVPFKMHRQANVCKYCALASICADVLNA